MAGPRPVIGKSEKGPRRGSCPVPLPLIARNLRPHVLAFHAFARAAEDIADDPGLAPEEKIARLDAFADVLAADPEAQGKARSAPGPELASARALARTLAARDVRRVHGEDLLAAYRQNALKSRYHNWRELMAYCRLAAAPCGRFLLELHGERGMPVRVAADALSAALKVINHIQDCRGDYLDLDRVYVPLEWLRGEGASVEELGAERASPALERVFGRMLDGVDALMAEARPLPRALGDSRLALGAGAMLALARSLVRKLRKGDPLAGRMRLDKREFVLIAAVGARHGLLTRWPGGRARAASHDFP